jgi:type IV secretory pathway TraG/TraD family ATPase VirD4
LFKTILVTGGLRESAEYISNIIGTIEEKETKQNKPLMTPDEVRRLDRDEMLIICNNKRPVKDYMLDIYGIGRDES